jgi:hypothetical protein
MRVLGMSGSLRCDSHNRSSFVEQNRQLGSVTLRRSGFV